MKKCFILFISFILLTTFVSCSSPAKYTVLEVGGYDHMSEAAHSEEINLELQSRKKLLVASNKNVEINDREYNVQYEISKEGYLYNNDVDYYRAFDKGVDIQIGINSKNGRIDSYSWVDVNYTDQVKGTELTREECLNIAVEYLAEYVEDASDYELIGERYLEIPEYKAIYDLEFARVIDGIKTSDSAYVGVTVYGTVISHLFSSLGELKGASLPSETDMSVIQDNINKKLEVIYGNVSDQYTVSHNVDDTVLVKLSDGRCALEYYISTDLTQIDGSAAITETTKLLIYLD